MSNLAFHDPRSAPVVSPALPLGALSAGIGREPATTQRPSHGRWEGHTEEGEQHA